MTHYLRLDEACELTGLSSRTIYRLIKAGAFCASLPAGDRGGWRIVRPSFEHWWNSRMGATSNSPAGTAKQQGVKK